MNTQEMLQFQQEFFYSCCETTAAKNADYTGKSDDPFANFQTVEVFGIATEVGFFTRMTDKMSRLAGFIKNGTLEVKEESVIDTLKDLANYSSLFAAYLEHMAEKKRNEKEKPW